MAMQVWKVNDKDVSQAILEMSRKQDVLAAVITTKKGEKIATERPDAAATQLADAALTRFSESGRSITKTEICSMIWIISNCFRMILQRLHTWTDGLQKTNPRRSI